MVVVVGGIGTTSGRGAEGKSRPHRVVGVVVALVLIDLRLGIQHAIYCTGNKGDHQGIRIGIACSMYG